MNSSIPILNALPGRRFQASSAISLLYSPIVSSQFRLRFVKKRELSLNWIVNCLATILSPSILKYESGAVPQVKT